MQAELYEITPFPLGRLAIMPRPRGAEWLMAELASLKLRGVTDVVSLLEPEEEVELRLQNEAKFCEDLWMRFHRFPIADQDTPPRLQLDLFVNSLLPYLAQQGFIAIHCMAGVGRSSVVAAVILCRLGLSGEEAIDRISNARGFVVPDTEEQARFILSFDNLGNPRE